MTQSVPFWLLIVISYIPLICILSVLIYTLHRLLKNAEKTKWLDIKNQQDKHILPLKLQAYERLALLCERMEMPNLIARIKTRDMSSGKLQSALMVAIQQEYEHNVTQQIYVSDKLWEVLKLTKMELFNQMNQVMIKTAFAESGDEYSKALLDHFTSQEKNDPISTAKKAIKQEARLYL